MNLRAYLHLLLLAMLWSIACIGTAQIQSFHREVEYNPVFGVNYEAMCAGIDSGTVVVSSGEAPTGAIRISTVVEYLDKSGNSVWIRNYQPTGFIHQMRSICQVDQSYVLAGSSDEASSANSMGSLMKISKSGNLEWRRVIRMGGRVSFNKVIYTQDNSILAVGTADTNGRPHAFMAKLDTAGNLLWSKLYDQGNTSVLYSVAENETGSYVGVGSASNIIFSADELTLHVAKSGQLLSIHLASSLNISQFRDIHSLEGGNFVIVGNANSFSLPPVVNHGTIVLADSTGRPFRMVSTASINGRVNLNSVCAKGNELFVQGYGSDSLVGNPKTFTQIFHLDTALDTVHWAYRFPSYSQTFSNTQKGLHLDQNNQVVFASQTDSALAFSRVQVFKTTDSGRYFCDERDQEISLQPRLNFPAGHTFNQVNLGHLGTLGLTQEVPVNALVRMSCDSVLDTPCEVTAQMNLQPDSICIGEILSFQALDNASNHRWFLDGQQFSIADTARFQATNTGTYEIQLISYDSICLDQTSKTVVVQQAAEVFVIPSELLVCPNERDDIRLYHSGVLSWNSSLDVEELDSVIHSVLLEVGTYTFYSSLSQSCRDSAILSVRAANQRDGLEEMDVEEVLSCDGVRLEAKLPGNLSSGIWPDGETKNAYTTVLDFSDSLFLEVLIPRDDLFCSSQITKSVRTEALDVYLNLPNVITPNGDQINDRFEFLNTNEFAGCAELSIYNRWGVEVYSDNGHDLSWDGRSFSGKELNAGVYFYRLTLQQNELRGNISLIR